MFPILIASLLHLYTPVVSVEEGQELEEDVEAVPVPEWSLAPNKVNHRWPRTGTAG